MSWEIKGWCPGALRPMESGDGLVVRMRISGGRLMPPEARAIAALARDCGNGLMDVTNRANLQLRGVTADSHPRVLSGLAALGLLDADAAAEARRNVILSPLAAPGSAAWDAAAEIMRLMADPGAPQVPGKFGFAVESGQAELAGVDADIFLTPQDDGADDWQIRASGCARVAAVKAGPRHAARIAVDLARWFVDSGGVSGGRGRMARHLGTGIAPPAILGQPGGTRSAPPVTVGPVPPHGFLVGLPFGQITADQLAALAEHGPLRLTPWRMLLVEGAADAPAVFGLIADPADPLLRVIACTGAPACPQGLADVRRVGRDLAPRLGPAATLHVSGCGKGCASRRAAAVTLVATGVDRFDLIENGNAAAPPVRRGIRAGDIIFP